MSKQKGEGKKRWWWPFSGKKAKQSQNENVSSANQHADDAEHNEMRPNEVEPTPQNSRDSLEAAHISLKQLLHESEDLYRVKSPSTAAPEQKKTTSDTKQAQTQEPVEQLEEETKQPQIQRDHEQIDDAATIDIKGEQAVTSQTDSQSENDANSSAADSDSSVLSNAKSVEQQEDAVNEASTEKDSETGQMKQDAAKVVKAPKISRAKNSSIVLNSISDVRRYFHRNETPIYFISATNFNVLGISEWVKNFRYINYVDCFDGRHPNVLVPSEYPHREFAGIEDINNYLLGHKEVIDYFEARGGDPKAVFLMFDETTEKLCEELGVEIWFPPSELRNRLDNKVETVRIGNRACVPSVPNVLGKVESYEHLRKVAGHLGDNLVVQTPYGDSGKTTYFIGNEDDWNKHAKKITKEKEVKVMKEVKCRGAAIEACTTKNGTLVGPLMTELVGFSELTPYKGGWCGNEIFPDAFTETIREKAKKYTQAFGDELHRLGYRGYFELDFLIEEGTQEIYLGELNPRVTGASSMTNHAAFAHADAPLFLFHLLEFSDVEFNLDIDELNERWARPENIDSWSQLVIKHVEDSTDYIKQAPQSGIWQMDRFGRIDYARFDYHRRAVEDERHGFYLRISGAGDYRYNGGDLGILITRGRLMDEDFQLNARARSWLKGITGEYWGVPIEEALTPPSMSLYDEPFKIL